MKVAITWFLGLDARSQAIANQALQRVFPQATSRVVDSLEAALATVPNPGGEILLLANPEEKLLGRGLDTSDLNGLPRWAIVVLGRDLEIDGVESVTLEELSESTLARAFRSAVAQHQLRRQNAGLQGDLRTVAHRIAHDLRSPLGGIVSTGEVLKEIIAESDPEAAILSQPIFDSTDDLMRLIERVSFALKATTNPQPKKLVSMNEVVWGALQRMERRVLKKGATITQADDWPEIAGVASWLQTIWLNLLANALEHGGASPRIVIGWDRGEKEHRFWVRDNGPGVASDKQVRLFQPFHQLHRPDATRGLGLSIVQRLVELQGGHCGYAPLPEGGSDFYFTLPVVKAVPENPDSA